VSEEGREVKTREKKKKRKRKKERTNTEKRETVWNVQTKQADLDSNVKKRAYSHRR